MRETYGMSDSPCPLTEIHKAVEVMASPKRNKVIINP